MTPQELVERALAGLGPAGGFAVVTVDHTANLRWANSTLTTNGISSQVQTAVVAFAEHPSNSAGAGSSGTGSSGTGSSGTAVGQADRGEQVDELVARARAIAEAADPAEDYGVPDPGWVNQSPDWLDDPQDLPLAALAPVSQLLGEVLPAGRTRGVEHYGYAEQAVVTTYLGTSSGLRARYAEPTARLELSGKAQRRTRSAWAGRAGRWLADLDLAGTAVEVDTGLARQARAVAVEPGRQTAILTPSAVADLLVYLYWSSSARDALDGRSALRGPNGTTAVGWSLTSTPLRISSDPHDPHMPTTDRVIALASSAMASPFDTGMPIPATDWVADGQVRALATTRATARRGALADTPPADNLRVDVSGATGDIDAVAAQVGEGLLVTCLWYIREVDAPSLLLTGLTRDGVYVVRGGEIVGAAGNFRFNESPLLMLSRICGAGAAQRCLPREWGDYFTRTIAPALAIADFNFSTASDAL